DLRLLRVLGRDLMPRLALAGAEKRDEDNERAHEAEYHGARIRMSSAIAISARPPTMPSRCPRRPPMARPNAKASAEHAAVIAPIKRTASHGGAASTGSERPAAAASIEVATASPRYTASVPAGSSSGPARRPSKIILPPIASSTPPAIQWSYSAMYSRANAFA